MPSRLSTLSHTIFESISKAFNCIRKPKETDEPDDIPEPLFSCYKLPLLVQEHIVRSMDTYEIMQCSLVSPSFRVIARHTKPKLGFLSMSEKRTDCYLFEGFLSIVGDRYGEMYDDAETLEAFRKPPPTIQFKINDQSEYFINFFWREQKNQLDIILEGRELTKISKDHWMTVIECNIIIYNSNSKYSELDDFQLILDIIFRVFTVDCFNLGGKFWYDSVFPKKHMFPLALRYRNSAQYFRLMQSRESGTCADLNSDELSLLLDNLDVPRVKMLWEVERGAKYTGTLKPRKMTLHRANWLTLDNILTMECEDFTASGPRWTPPEIISIVRKWQEGGFEKLNSLKFSPLLMSPFHQHWRTLMPEIEGTALSCYTKKICRSDGKKAVVIVNNTDLWINVVDDKLKKRLFVYFPNL